MTTISEKDRATHNRGKVDFVPIGDFGRGEMYALARVLPSERLLLDEVPITPSKKSRHQNRARARAVLAQAETGQRFPDQEIEKLQKRLQSKGRQDALRGVESEALQASQAIGEVRRSKLVKEAKDVLAKAEKGRPLPERDMERLQQKLLSMGRQDQVSGRESEVPHLADALGEIRRSRLVKQATDVLAKAAKGELPPDADMERLQQRLLNMGHQDQSLGGESDGFQLAYALGEFRRLRVLEDAKGILARARKGRGVSEPNVTKLQEVLTTMGRQQELLGEENEERLLVVALGELRRSQLVSRAKKVLAQGRKGNRVLDPSIAKLQVSLVSVGRQTELLGEESEEKQLAAALGELGR